MNPLIKFVLVATAAVTVLLAGAGGLLAYGLYHSGTVHVEIHDRSPHSNVDLDLPIPAGLVSALVEVVNLADLANTVDGAHVANMANAANVTNGANAGNGANAATGADAAGADPDGDFSPRRRLHAWRPAARAACQALADGPDGILIAVADGSQTVHISKRRDTLDIHVEGPGTDVRITAPAGLLRRLADLV